MSNIKNFLEKNSFPVFVGSLFIFFLIFVIWFLTSNLVLDQDNSTFSEVCQQNNITNLPKECYLVFYCNNCRMSIDKKSYICDRWREIK